MEPDGNHGDAPSHISRGGGFNLSRCRTIKHRKPKTKLRTDKKVAAKGDSGKKRSKSSRQPKTAKTLPLPSFQSHEERELEELQKSQASDIPPPPKLVLARTTANPVQATAPRTTSGPPIPSFKSQLCDADEDNGSVLLQPICRTKTAEAKEDRAVPATAVTKAPTTSQKTHLESDRIYHESITLAKNINKENLINHSEASGPVVPERAETGCSKKSDIYDNTSSNATTNKIYPKLLQECQPNHDELRNAIDHAFDKSNIDEVTVKKFTLHIAEVFHVKLTKKTVAFIKKRLYYLINDRVPSQSQNNPPIEEEGVGIEEHQAAASESKGASDDNPHGSGSMVPVDDRQGSAQFITEVQHSRAICQSTNPLYAFMTDKSMCQSFHTNTNSTTNSKAKTPPQMPVKTDRSEDIINLDSDSDESFQPVKITRKRCLKKSPPQSNDDVVNFVDDPTTNVEEPPCKTQKSEPKQALPEAKEEEALPPPPPPVAVVAGAGAIPMALDNTSTDLGAAKPAAGKATKKPAAKKNAAGTKPVRKRKAACRLCKTCPCKTEQKGAASLASPSGEFDLNKLKRSERAIDRKLESRLDELLREAERYEGEADRVRRELKKRARIRLRREQAELQDEGKLEAGKYHFLPDGRELDHQLESIESAKVSGEGIKKAQIKLFGKDKKPVSQPTLTQMFGGERNDSEEQQSYENGQIDMKNSEDDDSASCLEVNDVSCEGQKQFSPDDQSIDTTLSIAVVDDNDDVCASARRVLWRNGSVCDATENQTGEAAGVGSVWGCLVAAALQHEEDIDYGSGFNALFASGSAERADDLGLDHLLGLFEDAPSIQSSPAHSKLGCTPPPSENARPIDISMLTQRGKSRAQAIHQQVASSSDKVSCLEAAGIDWQENVIYAMHQRDPDELDEAMEKVQESKARLAMMKENLLKAIREQETVLDVFELSLKQSRERLGENELDAPFPGTNTLAASPAKSVVALT